MLFVAVVNSGCTQSQSGSDGGTTSGPLTAAELADWATEYQCKFAESCFGPAGKCTDYSRTQSRSLSLAAFERSISQQRISVTRSQLPTVNSINCENGLVFPVIGQVTVGGDCNNDIECTKGNYCSGATCPGKCTAKIANGGTCSETASCESGFCNNKVCTALANLNQPCQTSTCIQGLTCLGTQDGGNTCQVLAKRYTLERGAECTSRSSSLPDAFCKEGLACLSADGGQQGTCGSRVGEGGSCPNYSECDDKTICSGFVCKKFPGLNEACVEDQCAAGLNCDFEAAGMNGAGRCVQAKALGEACDKSFDCDSAYCSKDGKCEPFNVCPGK